MVLDELLKVLLFDLDLELRQHAPCLFPLALAPDPYLIEQTLAETVSESQLIRADQSALRVMVFVALIASLL